MEQFRVTIFNLENFIEVSLVGKHLIGTISNNCDAREISSQSHLGALWVNLEVNLPRC